MRIGSNDPQSWGVPVARAKWRNTEQLQTVQFQQPVKARYLKLVATAEANGNPFAAVAELDMLLKEASATSSQTESLK